MEIRSKEDVDRINEVEAEIKKEKEGKSIVKENLCCCTVMWNFYVHSPVTRFFGHIIGYILFLMLLSYVALLKKTTTTPQWTEFLLMVTVFGFLVAEFYQFGYSYHDRDFCDRFKSYICNIWNIFDWVCIGFFIIAVTLRCFDETLAISHLFYGIDASLWFVRFLQVFKFHKITGPYVIMIGLMFWDMFYFLSILLIFMFSYGVGVKAFLNPSPDSPQMFVQSIFHPYFHIYGKNGRILFYFQFCCYGSVGVMGWGMGDTFVPPWYPLILSGKRATPRLL